MKIKIIKIVFSIVVIIATIYFAYKNQHIIQIISSINASNFIFLMVYGFLSYLFVAIAFKYKMQLFGINLKFTEWYGLTATNTLYNYILPARTGFVARAYYLKNKYAFEYSKYISLLSGAFIISFLIASISAMALLLTKYVYQKVFYNELFLISAFLVAITSIISIILWKYPNMRIKTGWERLSSWLENVIAGLQYFKSAKKILLIVVITDIAQIFFIGIRLYFVFVVLHINVSLLDILIIQSLLAFSMLLSITPGNLGVKEGIIGLMAVLMGIPLGDAVLAAAIDRIIAMIVVFSSGCYFHFVLIEETKHKNDC